MAYRAKTMRMPSLPRTPSSRLHIRLRAAVLNLRSAYSMTFKCQAQYLSRSLICFPSKTSSARWEKNMLIFTETLNGSVYSHQWLFWRISGLLLEFRQPRSWSQEHTTISERITEIFVFKEQRQKSSPRFWCWPLLYDYRWKAVPRKSTANLLTWVG